MRSYSGLVRPDVAFIIAWCLVLACYLPIVTPLTPEFYPSVAMTLGFNLVTAPLIYYLAEGMVRRRLGSRLMDEPVLGPAETYLSRRFLFAIIALWGATFLAAIVYSGGLPLIWVLTGSAKTYADFGIPTVGGLSILLRSFAAILCIFLFVSTRNKIYLFLWAVLFVLCLSELSRSALFMLGCQSFGAFLLLKKLKLRQIVIAGFAALLMLGGFVLLGSLRGIAMNAGDFRITAFGGLPAGVYWVWAYIVSPMGNVNYAAAAGISPTYLPSNTLGAVVPSVIGDVVGLRATKYPIELISESLNATSIYAPLIADFSYAGAAVFISLFQLIASYAYCMARRGRLLYILVYPALFGALVLGIFYIYLMSLQILLVPVMVVWMRRYLARRKSGAGFVGHLQEEGA